VRRQPFGEGRLWRGVAAVQVESVRRAFRFLLGVAYYLAVDPAAV
jgi:hypothetical protein